MQIYSIISLIGLFFTLFLASRVHLKNEKKSSNKLFIIYGLSSALILFAQFQCYQSESIQRALFWIKMGSIWPLSFAFFAHFVITCAKRILVIKTFFLLFVYIPAIYFTIRLLLPGEIIPKPLPEGGFSFYSALNNSQLHILLMLWVIPIIIAILGLLLSTILSEGKIIEKKRVRKILMYLTVPLLFVIIKWLFYKLTNKTIPEDYIIYHLWITASFSYLILKEGWLAKIPESLALQVIDHIQEGLLIVSSEEIILSMNNSLRKLLDCTNEQAIGDKMNNLFDRLDFDPLIINSIISGEKIENHLWKIDESEKKKLFYSVSSYPVFSKKKKLLASILIFNDITELRKIMSSFELERSWLKGTLLSIGDGVIATDTEGRIIFMNFIAEELTGWQAINVIGMNINSVYTVYSSPDSEPEINMVEKVLKDGYLSHQTLGSYLKIKNGKEIPISYSGAPIKNLEGDTCGVILVFHDMTRKAILDAKLKQAQAQVIQSEKLASIGQLAAGVAHEINNPLGYIISNFNTLNKYITQLKNMINRTLQCCQIHEPPEGFLEEIKKINIDYILDDIETLMKDNSEGLERIRHIVISLKDFARVEEDRNQREILLNEAIERTLIIAKNEIKYAAEIEMELKSLDLIRCNPGEINQVILNIILNATDAIKSKGGMGKITIKTYDDEHFSICQISDTGCGIPQHIISRIYEPFFTTKGPGKGTGLGLNITYDIIVNKHHGEILVSSQPGEGTTFTIKLPNSKNISRPEA